MESPVVITRQDLYEMVWSEPMSSVAKRYDISDRGLAKICERLKVPKPGRGYWAKKAVGHRLKRPKLKPLPAGAKESVHIQPRAEGTTASDPEPTGPVSEQKAFEAKDENRIHVPERVGRYHPLVRATRVALRDSRAQHGRAGAPAGGLDVQVDRKSRARALRILDALIKGLEKRGFSVSVDAKSGTVVGLRDTQLAISLEERYRQRELPITERDRFRARLFEWEEPRASTELVPTGQLVLRIADAQAMDVRKSWADGKRQRVEGCLNSFVVGLVAAAEAKKAWQRELDERHRRWEEERRLAELERQRRLEEAARVTDLMERVERWETGQRSRRFLDAAQRSNSLRQELEDPEAWLEWAEGLADRLSLTGP